MLTVLLAAPAFTEPGLERWIRRLLVTSGLLAFAGLCGVVTGNMGIRNIGIFGYVGVFSIAAILLTIFFWNKGDDHPHVQEQCLP